MKILTAFIKTILAIVLTTFFALVLSFFLSMFFPTNVQNAINIFKNLFQIP